MKIIAKYMSINFSLLCIAFFALLLKLNDIGLLLTNKVVLENTLDFSWQSDSVERLLHGYILGKDFVFTYGPLFQMMTSFPSLLFHVSSYLSVELAPIFYLCINLLLLICVIKLLKTEKRDQPLLFVYLLFIVGAIAIDQLLLLRVLLPLVYALLLFTFIGNTKKLSPWSWLLCIMPTLFGLVTYDIFISCLALTVIIFLLSSFIYSKQNQKNSYLLYFFYITIVILIQIIFSFLFTHSFSYIMYSLDTVKNYYYIMGTAWSKDGSNILFFFPFVSLILVPYIYFSKKLPLEQKMTLFVLTIGSILEIKSAFIRSDSGHIIKAIYPSILSTSIILYFLIKERKALLILGCILFIFIPNKPIYYNRLSPNNVVQIVNVIHHKPAFNSLFTITDTYYSTSDIMTFENIIAKYKNNVLIYPYDSYLLNIQNTTFNIFPLQFYQYSSSITEEETVKKIAINPPKYIILGVDGKGALALDQIPNFTRNPLFAKFILQHYHAVTIKPNYIILQYEVLKIKNNISLNKDQCSVYIVRLTMQQNLMQYILDTFLKSPLYYLQTSSSYFRIPYTPTTNNYLIFENDTNATQLASFINKSNYSRTYSAKKQITVIRQSPFLHRKTVVIKKIFSVSCFE